VSDRLRRLRRWHRELVWRLRGRGRYARIVPLDEWSPLQRDAAIARGQELAAKYDWGEQRAKGSQKETA
jgi:hypothetical protein